MLRIGTDCSGIEAPIEACIQAKIPHKYIFACEIDKHCRKTLEANYPKPEVFYENIQTRDNNTVPDIDLYICGFPCQPFSNAGKRKGIQDTRGTIFWNCIELIKTKKPKFFILENVKGLLWHDKKRTWTLIQETLNTLSDYKVNWKILDTKDYGIPQSRARLYIVGRRDSTTDFEWIEKENSPLSLESYIDEEDNSKDTIREDVIKSKMLERIPKDAVFVDFSFKKHSYPNSGMICPAITADSRTWCVKKHRYANCKERARLQGFTNFKQVVSNSQAKKQIGNAMSVNVIKKLIEKIYKEFTQKSS